MIPRGSMNLIEIEMRARAIADDHCRMMDKKLESSLRAALGGKRISKERQDIIVDEFCDLMLGVK